MAVSSAVQSSLWQLELQCCAALYTRLQNVGNDSWAPVSKTRTDGFWVYDFLLVCSVFALSLQNISTFSCLFWNHQVLRFSSRRTGVLMRIYRGVLSRDLLIAIRCQWCRSRQALASYRRLRVSIVQWLLLEMFSEGLDIVHHSGAPSSG